MSYAKQVFWSSLKKADFGIVSDSQRVKNNARLLNQR